VSRSLVRSRRSAQAVIAACSLVVFAGAVLFFHATSVNPFDAHATDTVVRAFSRHELSAMLTLSTSWLVTALDASMAVVALALRHYRLAALAALAPAVATVLTEYVVKPIVDRRFVAVYFRSRGGSFYPSGHEAGVASLTTVAVIAVAALTVSRLWRAVAVSVAALVDAAAAIGLVGNHYHYATDTIAAVALSVATVLACALLIDRVGSGPRRPGRPDTWSTTESVSSRAFPATTTPRPGGAERPRPSPR
jgi:undecaprenyl-diphosphatase